MATRVSIICVTMMFTARATASEPAPAEVPTVAATKVALVTKETSDSTKTLLELAQVELSAEKSIDLLERQAIDRVLAEQKLSLSGLVDANTAVKVGKLLGVDVFAVLEMGGNKEALGVVVYDA